MSSIFIIFSLLNLRKMHKKRKTVLFIIGGVILLLLVRVLLDIPYRSNIPPITDLQSVTDSLKIQLTTASKKAYRNPTADNLGMLGMVYHSSANYEKAAICYKLAVKKNKSKWIWSYYLGYLELEMGESENAIKNFETVINENPEANIAWYYIGEGYQNIGSNDKAEIAFKKIATLKEKKRAENSTLRTDYFPLRIYAKYQLARIYFNTGKLDLAEQILHEILKENRTFGAAYRQLGAIYSKKGNTLLSNKYILRANDLTNYVSPVDDLIDKLMLLSKSDLYLLKQIDEAERTIYPEWAMKLLTNALRVTPENKYLISKAIKFYLKIGTKQLALPYLNKHLSYFKDNSNEIKEVADMLNENGAFSQSIVYFRQALKLKPNDTELQSNLVLALFNAGMKEESKGYMNDLLEKNRNNVDVLSNGVYILLAMGENDKAKVYQADLNRFAPKNPKVQQRAGMIAESEGNFNLALAEYEKSFNGDPTDLATIQMLGGILLKQEQWLKAINHYRKALEYHPNEPYLLEKLGSLLITCPDTTLRKIDEGMEYSERALDHKSSPMEIVIKAGSNLSDAYAAKGDKQTAITYLNSVIELAQSNNAPKEYLTNLGRKLKELSR